MENSDVEEDEENEEGEEKENDNESDENNESELDKEMKSESNSESNQKWDNEVQMPKITQDTFTGENRLIYSIIYSESLRIYNEKNYRNGRVFD